MNRYFDKKQRETISAFFNNLAVAWFIALFVGPSLSSSFDPLTAIRFLGNMVGSLLLALYFAKEE